MKTTMTQSGAVIALITGDDEAHLLERHHGVSEPPHEVNLTPQARPNVILEIGMALIAVPDKTIIVELERTRPISDIEGRHRLRFDGRAEARNALANRLRIVGVGVNTAGSNWLTAGNFEAARGQAKPPLGVTDDETPPARGEPSPPLTPVRIPHRAELRVRVVNKSGQPIRGAAVLGVSDDGRPTDERVTADDGIASLSALPGRTYAVLVAHPESTGLVIENIEPNKEHIAASIEFDTLIGSKIFTNGTGYIDGLKTRLAPIYDRLSNDRYFYASYEPAAINGSVDSMPYHFKIDEEITVEDIDGVAILLKFSFIRGYTSFAQYRWLNRRTE